jgi:sugar phosphate isomerase/epimerase
VGAIRLAVQSRLVPGSSLRDKHERAVGYGFDGIELSHFPMIEAAEEAIRYDVAVSAMCSGHRGWFIDPDPEQVRACRDDVKRLLELGARLDAPLIIVPIYGRTNRLPNAGTARAPEEDEALWMEGLREVAEHAEHVGGRLLIEAINRYENSVSVTLSDAVRFARIVASKNVFVMGDVFHMNIEEADIGASLEAAGDLLAYVHLADSQRLEPGQGHLDFAQVFSALARMRYTGWVSLECDLSGEPDAVLPPAVAYLRYLMEAAEAPHDVVG